MKKCAYLVEKIMQHLNNFTFAYKAQKYFKLTSRPLINLML